MARLGDNFVIMIAVQFEGSQEALSNIVSPLAGSMDLKQSLMEIEEGTHDIEPDVRINIYSDERMGIIEDVTSMLTESGLNILSLESNLDNNQPNNTLFILKEPCPKVLLLYTTCLIACQMKKIFSPSLFL